MNFYPFHIGDYSYSTRHLSWEEDLAYRRLLDAYYFAEQPLTSDFRQVCKLVLASTKEQRDAVDAVLNEFFELTDQGWAHRRCEAEISTMQEKRKKQSDKANKRWNKHASDHSNATAQKYDAAAMPMQCHNTERGNAMAMPLIHGVKQNDATAQKYDATAMPPIPIPIPIPNNKKIYNKKKCGSANDACVARPSDVDEDIWRDFLAIRKAKRAPLTPKALEGIQRETQKAGIALNDALLTCIERGWQGFSAEWITRKPTRIQPENFASIDYGVSGDI